MKKYMAKAVEAPNKLKAGAGTSRVSKSRNNNNRQCHKPAGKSEKALVKKHKHLSPHGLTESCRAALLDEGKFAAEAPKPRLCHEQSLHLSGKIKLQLFPMDEVTRMRLEEDGYHPYLELTLSSRKKISSVLKHLNQKWGGSSIVTKDPILLPYNLSEDLSGCRWTLNDIDFSAGDAYAAVGSPSVFRLRYGWLSYCQNESSEVPSTSTPSESCLQPKGMQTFGIGNLYSTLGKGKKIEEASGELKINFISRSADVSVVDEAPSGGSVEPVLNDGKINVGIGQSSLWDDCLTNISIGGLLSEASLQGRFNSSGPKSDGSKSGLLPSQLISDSLDAFIMSQVNPAPAPRIPQATSSSILDAEDTCHAFAFPKFRSSGKDAGALGGNAYSHTSSEDAIVKPLRNSSINEVRTQSSLPHGMGRQESETDLSLCSRLHNDESSLGLSGIKWTDSLGPFDLGLSSSRKIISGDSISLGRIIT